MYPACPQSVSVLATIQKQSPIYQSTLICVDVVTKNCFEVLNVSWEEKERFTLVKQNKKLTRSLKPTGRLRNCVLNWVKYTERETNYNPLSNVEL